MKNSTFAKYVILIILLIIIGETGKVLLQYNKLLSLTLAEQFTSAQIKLFFDFQKKWQLISLFFIPIIVIIKTTLVSAVLYIGTFFYSKNKITYKQLLDVAIKSEFVFLLVSLVKIVWFYFIQATFKLEDLQYFYPLSALSIVDYHALEPYFIYPFQVINMFELAYILLLGYYVGKIAYTTREKSTSMDFGLKIVASSYVPALFLWITIVMFFTLNYS